MTDDFRPEIEQLVKSGGIATEIKIETQSADKSYYNLGGDYGDGSGGQWEYQLGAGAAGLTRAPTAEQQMELNGRRRIKFSFDNLHER